MALFLHADMFSWVMIAVILIISFITVLYTFRMIWFIFLGPERTTRALAIKDPEWLMRIPVIILALCSLWLLVSWNPFDFSGWMFQPDETQVNSPGVTFLSAAWVLAALLVSWFAFRKARFRTSPLLRHTFYIDKAYNFAAQRAVRWSNHIVNVMERRVIDRGIHGFIYVQVIIAHVTGWFDRVLIDGTVNATARATGFGGRLTRSFAGGNIQLYVFWSVLAVIIFIIWALD